MTKVQERKAQEKNSSVGSELAEKAGTDLPRSLSSSAPALTAATAALTLCLHRERDPSKICLSQEKKKKRNHSKKPRAIGTQSQPPTSCSPFPLARPLTSAQRRDGQFTDLTFSAVVPSAARLQPGCLKSAAGAGCSVSPRLHAYLLRPDELPRNTPGEEVTSAGVPSFLPSFPHTCKQ